MRTFYALMALCILSACHSSANSRYYTLSPSPAANYSAVQQSAVSWNLAKVTVPALLDRPQIVLKTGANEVKLLEYDRWAEPVQSMVLRVLNQDLTARIGINPPAPAPEHNIIVAIDELSADSAGHVTLKASWMVQDTMPRTLFEESMNADSADISAIVAAMSHLLGDLADAIARRH